MTNLRRATSTLAIAVLLASGIAATTLTSPTSASATSPSDFNAGYIVSDQVFFNSSTLSVEAIQSFLNGKVATCGGANGIACLKDYHQDTQSQPTQSGGQCSAYAGASNESAATIIYKTAVACGINPQVLIVLLEKEQGLVSERNPTARQYAAATGFGCPDTAPCNPAYAAFASQLYSAAWQFENYTLHPNSYRYHVGANTILYNPDSRCGTSTVNIANQATANLYNYTPYQPNSATLNWKLGSGPSVSSLYPDCGAFGNINFFSIFSNWFGSPTGNANANLDSAKGVFGGVKVSGWSVDPASTASSYIWVNIDGVGGPHLAGDSLAWFNAYKPGFGANHGFSPVVPAQPGTHVVCVYQVTTLASVPLGCPTVTVPPGAGNVDSVTAIPGGVTATGWSVSFATADPSSITVSVNGVRTVALANVALPWFNASYPGAGLNHGFAVTIRQPIGTYQVCVNDVTGSLGCSTVSVTTVSAGSFDSATGGVGRISLTGWSADLSTTASSYIWVNIDGQGGPQLAQSVVPWFEALFPSAGLNHGFDLTLAATPGPHNVCIFGTNNLSLGCKTITVLGNAAGSFDTSTATVGGTRLTGWSADLSTSSPSYIWVNVDGVGGPYLAAAPLPWFGALYSGVGINHGFDITVPLKPGAHSICVFGTNSQNLGCKTTSPQNPAAGSFDTATAASGGIAVTGWSVDLTTANPSYIWVNVDGQGGPYLANAALPWFGALYPNVGINHGFAATVPASRGNHEVCVFGTNSQSLGCKTVFVG